MLRLWIALVPLLATGAFAQEAGPAFPVSGMATVVTPNCGGALRPPNERQKTTPLVDTFLVKRGKQNSQDAAFTEFTSDATGRFQTKLPRGSWCVVQKSGSPVPPSVARAKPREAGAPVAFADETDVACLDAVWRECLQVLEIDGGVTDLALTRYEPCAWQNRCGPSGPPPPSVPRR
jgi:hypothetical protein